jgi:hypothetical protein
LRQSRAVSCGVALPRVASPGGWAGRLTKGQALSVNDGLTMP